VRPARLEDRQTAGRDGSITTTREDIYGGKIVNFVPFTKLDGDKIVGNHNRYHGLGARHSSDASSLYSLIAPLEWRAPSRRSCSDPLRST